MSWGSKQAALGENTKRFLRERHPTKTALNVSADTGLSPAQIERWLEGTSGPSGAAMLALTEAYGPQFLAAVLPSLHWLDESVRVAKADRLQRQMADIERQLAELNSTR
jgi:transcriptional regulator with XRE-family HTH domain